MVQTSDTASIGQGSQGRCHVLVEAPARWSFAVKGASRLGGCDVAFCGGPEHRAECPILAGEPCPFIDRADVVVAGLGLGTAESRRIVDGTKRLHPDKGVVLLVWRADLARHPECLEGCEAVVFPWTTRKLSRAVAAAARDAAQPAE